MALTSITLTISAWESWICGGVQRTGLPIEVKSGKDYDRHNALSNVMASTEYKIPHGLVLCNGNIETKER